MFSVFFSWILRMKLRPSCLCNGNFTSWAISPTQGATVLYGTAGCHETLKQQCIMLPSAFQSSHVRSFMLLQKDWLKKKIQKCRVETRETKLLQKSCKLGSQFLGGLLQMRMQKGEGMASEMREASPRKNTGKLDGNLISASKFGLWEEKRDVWGEIRVPYLWGPWNYHIIRNMFFRKFLLEEKAIIKTGPSQRVSVIPFCHHSYLTWHFI